MKLKNDEKGGDIFENLTQAINYMKMHTNNRKTKKRIFLFTNGMGASIHDLAYVSNYQS